MTDGALPSAEEAEMTDDALPSAEEAEMTDDIRVSDNPERHRFEVHVGDELAGIAAYRLEPGQIVFTHTEIEPAFEGRGLAGRLAAEALDAARQRGLAVVPRCPYIASYIRRHPQYADLVVSGALPQA